MEDDESPSNNHDSSLNKNESKSILGAHDTTS